ncbi:TVP38/TMEM64 family protein [Pallidibacillus pasinlerensis]|uniref:TVP38/TMEM64 family membrane protein n=1 Tax=Pallidibacillus pasinlerensis TaxID=2703818 RepID=A0ABW9ZZG4_9BACI|nr:TVP38/TMEM64 family protein [Pallidibacillus pasinlerensis]NCU16564.1 TVP38/TMEM64 family protein [Pallidibacillus pasinlerensis]
MDFSSFKAFFTEENLMELLEGYRSFGILPGILLPMIEAFLPFLPLIVFVTVNANAFGLGIGFLVSWLGAVIGAMLVFYVVRKFGQKRFMAFVSEHKRVKKLVDWVDRRGFGPLFLILCFPFTPSAVVNIVAGLSKISIYQYGLAVTTGKMVMIFVVSYIGHDIPALIHNPMRTLMVIVLIVILWYVGKRVEIYINKKVESDTPVKEKMRE